MPLCQLADVGSATPVMDAAVAMTAFSWSTSSNSRHVLKPSSTHCLLPMLQVTANPELRGVVARGASMLPTRMVERAFKPLYGQPLNFVAFGKAVKKLDDWYQQRGILGQVS